MKIPVCAFATSHAIRNKSGGWELAHKPTPFGCESFGDSRDRDVAKRNRGGMARSIWLQEAKSYENLSSRVQKGKNTSLYPETNASHTNFHFKTDIYGCFRVLKEYTKLLCPVFQLLSVRVRVHQGTVVRFTTTVPSPCQNSSVCTSRHSKMPNALALGISSFAGCRPIRHFVKVSIGEQAPHIHLPKALHGS